MIEIAKKLYQFSIYIPLMDFTIHQYLYASNPSILFAAGTAGQAKHILPEIKEILGERELKYIFVSHMESDEAGGISVFKKEYPNVTVICGNLAARELGGYGYDGNVIAKCGEDIIEDGELKLRLFDYPAEVHNQDGIVCLEENRDRVDLIAERKFKGRPAEQHDDGLFAAFRKRVDQFQMLLRHPHVLAVAALGFVFIRQSRKDQHRVAFRKRDALHAVRVEGVLRRCDLRRADHGAARALVAHVREQVPRDVQLFRALERQHAVVFQKNRAVRRDLARKRVMRIPVHGRGIGGLCVPVDPVQDIASTP